MYIPLVKGRTMAKAKAKSGTKRGKTSSKAPRSKRKASSKPAQDRVQAKVEGTDSHVSGQKEHRPKQKQGPKRASLAQGTFFAKLGQTNPEWKLVDAAGQTLGRLATQVANILMGKDKPTYTRHAATGDFVIVVNATKVRLTGNKLQDKKYYSHTGYPGGIKEVTAEKMLQTHPERVIRYAIHGMLPKGHVGRIWYKRLRVFAGPDHPHQAQKPQTVALIN